jgi:hypothetical protein
MASILQTMASETSKKRKTEDDVSDPEVTKVRVYVHAKCTALGYEDSSYVPKLIDTFTHIKPRDGSTSWNAVILQKKALEVARIWEAERKDRVEVHELGGFNNVKLYSADQDGDRKHDNPLNLEPTPIPLEETRIAAYLGTDQ